MFLLDTNVVAEIRKVGMGKGDPRVTAWNEAVDGTRTWLSAITLHETEIGILRLERRDPGQGAILRRWMVDTVLPTFRNRTIDVDWKVVAVSATFHVPSPAPYADSLIAATALVHGLTVATRNAADFRRFGVPLVNPWEG